MIKIGIIDADSEVRTNLSLVFWQYLKLSKRRAITLYSSLNDRQKNILRDKCPSSVFDLQDSFNNSKNEDKSSIVETRPLTPMSNKTNHKRVDSPLKPLHLKLESLKFNIPKKQEPQNKENVILPKPQLNKPEFEFKDNSNNKPKGNENFNGRFEIAKDKENLEQTQLDSSNLMYGPAGYTPFIPKIHSSDKVFKLKGDDLVLEMKFETLYIDLESNEVPAVLFALEKLQDIFKHKSKIPISYIPKLWKSLENLLLNQNDDVILSSFDVIILFVTSYHLEPHNWLEPLMGNVLSLSRRGNFNTFSVKTEQLIHVLQTIIDDETIVKYFLDYFRRESLQNSINVLNIFCNLLMNISETDINNILDMVFNDFLEYGEKFSDLSNAHEYKNIFIKIAGINELVFQKFYDSLNQDKKEKISRVFKEYKFSDNNLKDKISHNNNFTEKDFPAFNVSVLEDNITVRKQKSYSESDADSIKKSVIDSGLLKNTISSSEFSKMNLDQLLVNLKELVHTSSEPKNSEVLEIIRLIIQQESAEISAHVSNIIDILGFYIQDGENSMKVYSIIDSLISITSIKEFLSCIIQKLSKLIYSQSEGVLSVLKYILSKCDRNNSTMIEMIEILPKLLRIWMVRQNFI